MSASRPSCRAFRGRLRAGSLLAALLISTSIQAGVDRWTPLGPYIQEVVGLTEHPTDPSLLYARFYPVTPLLRSRDAGQSWQPVSRELQVALANGWLFSAGSGWSVSTDGGYAIEDRGERCWPSRGPELYRAVADPRDPLVVFAFDDDHGPVIFRSVDGGCDWSPLDAASDERWIGVQIDSDTVRTVYAYSPSTLVRSTDQGATWTSIGPALSPNCDCIRAFAQSGTSLLVSTGDAILRSDDGGSTWAPSNNGLPSKAAYRFDRFVSGAGDSPVLYVHANPNPVAVPTQPMERDAQLYRSDDSGRTWAPIGPPNASALLVSRHHPNRLYGVLASAFWRRDLAFRAFAISDDGGATWVPASAAGGMPEVPVTNVHADPVYGARKFIVTTDVVIRTLDRGRTWTNFPLVRANNYGFEWPRWGSPTRGGVLYASQSQPGGSVLLRSFDFGDSWTALDRSDVVPPDSYMTVEESVSSPTTIYWAGTRYEAPVEFPRSLPVVLRSDDDGSSWSLRVSGLPEFVNSRLYGFAVAPSDPETVYIAFGRLPIYGTNDGGASWTRRAAGLPDPAVVTVLAVSPTDPSTVFAGFRGGLTEDEPLGFYATTDGGASWTRRDRGLPAGIVTAIAIDPNDSRVVYVGLSSPPWSVLDRRGNRSGGLGVYRSVDGGLHFSPMTAGLPARGGLRVNRLEVDPTDTRTLVAATESGLHTITVSDDAATEQAIEYYEPSFDHYFVTTEALSETAPLDRFEFPEWARTGRSFPVDKTGASGSAPVCRFFSGGSFAPKSSHFYTPYDFECSLLRQGSVWQYEGDVFGLRLPVGQAGAATCPAPTVPLYRAYNNGQRGAPNHRYTDDLATLDRMIAQGWVFEGHAQTKVFACIPGPR